MAGGCPAPSIARSDLQHALKRALSTSTRACQDISDPECVPAVVACSGAAPARPSLQRTSGSWSSGRWGAWWRPKAAEDTYVGRLLTWLRIRKRSAASPPGLRRSASDLFDRPSGVKPSGPY